MSRRSRDSATLLGCIFGYVKYKSTPAIRRYKRVTCSNSSTRARSSTIWSQCSAMQSFEPHQAGTGNPEGDISNRIAGHAAARLALPDHKLDKFRARLVRLVLACILVDLIDLIVPASQ